MDALKGKVVFATGATKGLGAEIALAVAREELSLIHRAGKDLPS